MQLQFQLQNIVKSVNCATAIIALSTILKTYFIEWIINSKLISFWYLLSRWSGEFDSPFLLVSMIGPWQCYAYRDEYTHFPDSTSQMVCSRGDSAQLQQSLWTIMPPKMWWHKSWWDSCWFWKKELFYETTVAVLNRIYKWIDLVSPKGKLKGYSLPWEYYA